MTENICKKVLKQVPPSHELSRRVLSHLEKRFEGVPLAPILIIKGTDINSLVLSFCSKPESLKVMSGLPN